MPEFATPFSCKKSDRKLTKEELIRAIRFSISAEFESIQLYEELKESIDDENAKKLLNEISDDEKVHVGNFLHLLIMLSPEEEDYYKEGCEEAAKVINGEEGDN